jgi:hypothetical protein
LPRQGGSGSADPPHTHTLKSWLYFTAPYAAEPAQLSFFPMLIKLKKAFSILITTLPVLKAKWTSPQRDLNYYSLRLFLLVAG